MTTPLIFDIKTFAVHDGPGIRTTFFLKGCPLRCKWCQNPESMSPEQYLAYNSLLCVRCGACRTVCDKLDADFMLEKDMCTLCGNCIEVCLPSARKFAGRQLTPQEICDIAIADKTFFDTSGGGVTFSGGECMLYPDFLHAALTLLKTAGIHTCIDTCGAVPTENFQKLEGLVDLFLYDLKKMDSALHKEYTGMENALILKNLQHLCTREHRVIIRVPLIPGLTDSREDIRQIGSFVCHKLPHPPERIELLPYNKLAESKYTNNTAYHDGGISYPLGHLDAQQNSYISELQELLTKEYGLNCFAEIL